MSKEDKTKKVRKAVNVAGIVMKIILFLAGLAMLAFLVWLGVSVWQMFEP